MLKKKKKKIPKSGNELSYPLALVAVYDVKIDELFSQAT